MVHRHVASADHSEDVRRRLALGHRHAGVLRHDATFSDFKSRGFGLEDSQLQRTDRMDRLILVMSLALYTGQRQGDVLAMNWSAIDSGVI